MARANMNSLAERDVAPLPERTAPTEPQPAPRARATPRAPQTTGSELEEALGTDVPVSLKRELKATSAAHGEKMKHVVARAIRRELDRMKETE